MCSILRHNFIKVIISTKLHNITRKILYVVFNIITDFNLRYEIYEDWLLDTVLLQDVGNRISYNDLGNKNDNKIIIRMFVINKSYKKRNWTKFRLTTNNQMTVKSVYSIYIFKSLLFQIFFILLNYIKLISRNNKKNINFLVILIKLLL